MPTVSEIEALTVARVAGALAVPEAAERTELRVFCFPHAVGAASAYRPWLRDVPDGVEIVLVQLPGRDVTPTILAAELATALAARLDVRYALVGTSVGAVVAAESAREIARRGGPEPAHLVVASARPRTVDGPVLGCPVTAFVGADDDSVSLHDALDWRPFTTGPFAVHVLAGDHFALLRHRDRVLAALRSRRG